MFFDQLKVACITLRSRRDKQKYITKELKKQGLSVKVKAKGKSKKNEVELFRARLHKNPKRGCLESHLKVIRKAIKDNVKYLLVLEDDAKFLKPLAEIPHPPKTGWAMLYLGGTVKSILDPEVVDDNWTLMSCWTTHAYIINLTNKDLVADILKADEFKEEIDTFYIKKIHHKHLCYMVTPMMVIQREGYSDIEKEVVNYDFMQDTLMGFQKPEHEEKEGNYILTLPDVKEKDLPSVTIVTPTRNRRVMFQMAINNYLEFNYPKDKMEWIILDDTPKDQPQIVETRSNGDKYLVGGEVKVDDDRVKYQYIYSGDSDYKEGDANKKERWTIAKKRNFGANMATNDIILHMDDDDYYPKDSILARVKLLLKYKDKGVGCVGSSTVGVYDIVHNTSQMASDGAMSLSEASMGYWKSFWEAQPFDEKVKTGEYQSFITGRIKEIMDVPYSFIIFAISHKRNYSGKLKETKRTKLKYKGSDEMANFFDMWDEEVQDFVGSLRKCL